jgi:hypothetical protein
MTRKLDRSNAALRQFHIKPLVAVRVVVEGGDHGPHLVSGNGGEAGVGLISCHAKERPSNSIATVSALPSSLAGGAKARGRSAKRSPVRTGISRRVTKAD